MISLNKAHNTTKQTQQKHNKTKQTPQTQPFSTCLVQELELKSVTRNGALWWLGCEYRGKQSKQGLSIFTNEQMNCADMSLVKAKAQTAKQHFF